MNTCRRISSITCIRTNVGCVRTAIAVASMRVLGTGVPCIVVSIWSRWTVRTPCIRYSHWGNEVKPPGTLSISWTCFTLDPGTTGHYNETLFPHSFVPTVVKRQRNLFASQCIFHSETILWSFYHSWRFGTGCLQVIHSFSCESYGGGISTVLLGGSRGWNRTVPSHWATPTRFRICSSFSCQSSLILTNICRCVCKCFWATWFCFSGVRC